MPSLSRFYKTDPPDWEGRLFWDQQLVQTVLEGWAEIRTKIRPKKSPFDDNLPDWLCKYGDRLWQQFSDHPATRREEEGFVVLNSHPEYFNYPASIIQHESYNPNLYECLIQELAGKIPDLSTFLKIYWRVWRSMLPYLDELDHQILATVLGTFQPANVLGWSKSSEIRQHIVHGTKLSNVSDKKFQRAVRRLHHLGIIWSRPVFNLPKLGLVPVLCIDEKTAPSDNGFGAYWWWRHPVTETKMVYLAALPWQHVNDQGCIPIARRVIGINFDLYNASSGWCKEAWLNKRPLTSNKPTVLRYQGAQLDLCFKTDLRTNPKLNDTDIKLLTELQVQGRGWKVEHYAKQVGLDSSYIYRRLQRFYNEEIYKHLFVFQTGLNARFFILGRNLDDQKTVLINYLTKFPRYSLFEGESDLYAVVWIPESWMTEVIDQSKLVYQILGSSDVSIEPVIEKESQPFRFSDLWDSDAQEWCY
ncbi:MAG: hypothetical protein ACFFBD_01530 [Candidatus Hodarchaeota archaeon]